ncbi:MAG TPA: hypothetical protein VFO29_11325 [Candidatus Rubrimentiphilum sp.]|nr:hypothetical protein [Candidatus Rubrimentiphilum sp.]
MTIRRVLIMVAVFVMGMGTAHLLESPKAFADTFALGRGQVKADCPAPVAPRPQYVDVSDATAVARYECLWDPPYMCPPGFKFATGGPRDYGFLNLPDAVGIKWTCQQVKVAKN